jgi:hypothetical protein
MRLSIADADRPIAHGRSVGEKAESTKKVGWRLAKGRGREALNCL